MLKPARRCSSDRSLAPGQTQPVFHHDIEPTTREPCQIHPLQPSGCVRTPSGGKRNRVTKKVIKTLSKRTFTSLAAKDFDQALSRLEGRFVEDRQGRGSPRAASQHGRSPQEQARAGYYAAAVQSPSRRESRHRAVSQRLFCSIWRSGHVMRPRDFLFDQLRPRMLAHHAEPTSHADPRRRFSRGSARPWSSLRRLVESDRAARSVRGDRQRAARTANSAAASAASRLECLEEAGQLTPDRAGRRRCPRDPRRPAGAWSLGPAHAIAPLKQLCPMDRRTSRRAGRIPVQP